ncbi:MAG: hypothetical protein ABIG61_02440 [Planctomycetota bacterium]
MNNKSLKISAFLSCVLLLFIVACEPQSPQPVTPPAKPLGNHCVFTPAVIKITQLSNFSYTPQSPQDDRLIVYIELLDEFGSQIKSPAIFRFELYHHMLRSAEPRGKRVNIWPDIDLTGPAENNKYWHNPFRSYYFDLPLPISLTEKNSYVLHATCLTPVGRRLVTTAILAYK